MTQFRKWTAAGCNIALQTVAQAVSPVVRYASLLLLAHILSVREMDRCALYLTSSLVLANLCDLGMNIAFLKFSADIECGSARLQTQRRMLWARVLLAGGVGIAALLLAGPLASRLLHRPDDALVLRLAAGSALLGAISSYTLAMLQSKRRFLRIACTAGGSAVLQVAPLALAATGQAGGLVVLCLADAIGKLAIVGANLPMLLRVVLAKSETAAVGWQEIVGFVRWIGLSTAVGAVSNYIPTLALARSGLDASLTTYLLGAGLAGWISMPVQAAMAVLLPEAMAARSRTERISYIRTWLPAATAVAFVAAPCLWYLAPWMVKLTGARYAQAVDVFRILSLAQLSLLIVNPVQFLLYSLDRPALCFAGDLFIAGAFFAMAMLHVPPANGAKGIAVALLISQAIGKLGMMITTLRLALDRGVQEFSAATIPLGVSEA